MKTITTNSEQETFDFAQNYAQELQGGEIIGLDGDLGAGKTIFSKGLAKGLDVKNIVTSPTFVIMKVYDANHPKIKKLCHIDAYRITSAEDIIAIGAEEYFNRSDAVTIIEWAGNIKKILPPKTKFIEISHLPENQRKITY